MNHRSVISRMARLICCSLYVAIVFDCILLRFQPSVICGFQSKRSKDNQWCFCLFSFQNSRPLYSLWSPKIVTARCRLLIRRLPKGSGLFEPAFEFSATSQHPFNTAIITAFYLVGLNNHKDLERFTGKIGLNHCQRRIVTTSRKLFSPICRAMKLFLATLGVVIIIMVCQHDGCFTTACTVGTTTTTSTSTTTGEHYLSIR